MKLNKLISVAVLLLSITAQAEYSWLECENGEPGTMGDGYLRVSIYEDGISFEPYESFFWLDSADLNQSLNTFTTMDQYVNITSEGMTWNASVNFIGTLNRDRTKFNIALSTAIDQPFRAEQLSCSLVFDDAEGNK